ncbi:pectinesterase 1-like [Spinacia oleracea]|uniref:Pectinesterase n=1 Tax=Spinacia oleracea TaxID=3562 RepID=A0A9R0IYW6_SPIOL|nr:pectinesterase 1-like [Spinacia oleracea]
MVRQLRNILAGFLLVNVIFTTTAQTEIPAKKADINTWFKNVVKPVSLQKGKLDQNLVEAESDGVEIIEVRQDGTGKFKTISDAVKHVKIGNTKRVIIKIGPGEYREKVKVDRFKAYVTFYGTDPKNMPTITFSGTASEYGTVDSATLIVMSDYFVATNIIVSNSAPRPSGKKKGQQAVALRITGDKASFYNCKFIGFQDTVCDDKGKHFFKDCYIEGTVDFIFGEAKTLYLNTELHVLSGDLEAFIVAHARKNPSVDAGYSFVHCPVTGTGGHGYLGRPWYGESITVFSYCDISNVIKPAGWDDHYNPASRKVIYFGEYKNTGPGAILTKRVPYTKKLTEVEAKPFINLKYIDAEKWLLPPPKL